MKRSFLLLLAAACLPLFAGELLPPEVTFLKDGSFTVGGLSFEIRAYNQRWNGVANAKWREVDSRVERSGMEVKGTLLIDGGKGRISVAAIPAAADAFTVNSAVAFAPPVQLKRLAGIITLPLGRSAIEVDGKPLSVPADPGESTKLYSGKPREIVLCGYGAEELAVSGMTEVLIQDNRKFKSDNLSVMFFFTPASGEISNASLNLRFQLRRLATQRIPLDAFVNRAFRDEPGAAAPGWTAQGREEDLRLFQPGKVSALGVEFDVSPSGAVAVGGEKRGGVPKEQVIPVSLSGNPRALTLLHTSAWTPPREFGELEVRFADGSSQKYPVSGLRDCGNWVRPRELANAAVAWRGKRPDSEIGVYLSTFPLPEKKTPVSVTLRSTSPDVIWLVLGLSFTDRELYLPAVKEERETRITAGKEWFPLNFRNRVAAGSPFDFSSRLDAPAGKYGYARPAADGSLRFENAPERRLKLYGTNLCQSANFPSKESADLIADLIARNGYNSVRFHHHDNGLVDPKAANSTTLDPEQLDRLDYLFAALKKRGIYLTTDFYTSRVFRSGDGIAGDFSQPKALFPIDAAAMENWKTFVRNWMTHRNPYTGLTWAEDPALVMVNLVNEDNLDDRFDRAVALRDRYAAEFETWKKKHGSPNARADRSDRRFLEFLCEMQARSLAEMSRFAKEELKVQASLTSLNFHYNTWLTPLRDRFDVVDNHQYHSHPGFPGKAWSLPRKHNQSSAISAMASTPRSMMATRVTGKPFFVTEFNYCIPNRYRVEGGPLAGGYAALQDWDGLYRFCYSHNIRRIENSTIAVGSFESVGEPLMQLADRIIASLFLRGDAAPAPEAVSCAVPEQPLQPDYPTAFSSSFQMLGLVTRIGSHVEGHALPPGVTAIKNTGDWNAAGTNASRWRDAIERKQAVSSTGELRLDANAELFIVRTPRTESLTLPKGALTTGGVLSVSGIKNFQTIAATSLDGKPLTESRSILLLHLTDVSNSDAVFADEDRQLLTKEGKMPLLVRRDRIDITLKLSPGSPLQVQALSADGDPLGTVPATNNTFTAATDLFPGGVVAYHLTR